MLVWEQSSWVIYSLVVPMQRFIMCGGDTVSIRWSIITMSLLMSSCYTARLMYIHAYIHDVPAPIYIVPLLFMKILFVYPKPPISNTVTSPVMSLHVCCSWY